MPRNNNTRLQQFLMVMGAIFMVILLAAAAVGIGLFARGKVMDKESAAFVTDAVKAVATDWNADELLKRAHPTMTANTKPDAYKELFDKIRTIGTMKKFDGCAGESAMSYAPGTGIHYNAGYQCKAEFEKAPAILTIAVVKEKAGIWQIRAINIDSPFFNAKPTEAQ